MVPDGHYPPIAPEAHIVVHHRRVIVHILRPLWVGGAPVQGRARLRRETTARQRQLLAHAKPLPDLRAHGARWTPTGSPSRAVGVGAHLRISLVLAIHAHAERARLLQDRPPAALASTEISTSRPTRRRRLVLAKEHSLKLVPVAEATDTVPRRGVHRAAAFETCLCACMHMAPHGIQTRVPREWRLPETRVRQG